MKGMNYVISPRLEMLQRHYVSRIWTKREIGKRSQMEYERNLSIEKIEKPHSKSEFNCLEFFETHFDSFIVKKNEGKMTCF